MKDEDDIFFETVGERTKFILEMYEKQLKTVPLEKKLRFKDFARISKHIDTSIFSDDECSLWNGERILKCSCRHQDRGVNFSFKDGKKIPLHRLLYENFIGPLEDECVTFSCGWYRCCNVNHLMVSKQRPVLSKPTGTQHKTLKVKSSEEWSCKPNITKTHLKEQCTECFVSKIILKFD